MAEAGTMSDFHWTELWCLQVQHVKGYSVAQAFEFSDYNAAHNLVPRASRELKT
jgi:hypothetical protein